MKYAQTVLIVGFFAIIFGLGITSLVTPDRASSWWENRTLAQAPTVTVEGLTTGKVFKEYEKYVTDQFPGRDDWMAAYTKFQLAQGKTFVNNTHVTPDGLMIKRPMGETPAEQLTATATALNELGAELAKREIPYYFMVMPAKVNMLADYLPPDVSRGYGKENKANVLSQIDPNMVKVVDGETIWRTAYSREQIPELYFKTDHHWNIEGAMFGYRTVIDSLAQDFPDMAAADADVGRYTLRCVNRVFMGSWNKQLAGQVTNHGDQPCYYDPTTYSYQDFLIYKGPIDSKNLIAKDAFYATGLNQQTVPIDYATGYMYDQREITLVNKKSPNKLRALILKDSFTNPILFYLGHHFEQTTFYDIRHNPDRSVYEFIAENEFDVVITLYNDELFFGPLYIFNRVPTQP
ncbi:DHHW family protein [Brevibacillus dissolubilis]|uniref:DHHW family protein n=1 Tax=Brevibacillus dissolubilis TaxID=1844116 RepID=UPI001116767B|nr:DHHW family protein [Brevibacillus dissolubilis]